MRSSPPRTSNLRSIGSLRTTCSASAGVIPCSAICSVLPRSQSNRGFCSLCRLTAFSGTLHVVDVGTKQRQRDSLVPFTARLKQRQFQALLSIHCSYMSRRIRNIHSGRRHSGGGISQRQTPESKCRCGRCRRRGKCPRPQRRRQSPVAGIHRSSNHAHHTPSETSISMELPHRKVRVISLRARASVSSCAVRAICPAAS